MDTHTRISKWLDGEIDKFVRSSGKISVEFPSKKNFVDSAVLKLLEEKGVKLNKKILLTK